MKTGTYLQMVVASLTLTLLVVSSCNKKSTDSEPPQPPKPTKGSVQGTVTDAENAGYIRYVVVSIAGQAASTDNYGWYKIDSILAGSYAVTTSRNGYEPHSGTVNVTAGSTTSYSFSLQPSGPSSHSVTLNAVADSYTSSGLPTSNFGSEGNFSTGQVNFGTVSQYRAFVRFDVSSIPSGAQITNATLRLITGANSVPAGTITTASVDVSEVTGTSWTESGLTYTNSPVTFSYLYSRNVSFGPDANQYTWTVTSTVAAWVSGSHTNRGFSVKSNGIVNPQSEPYDYCDFYARETSGWGPQLVVEYLY